MTRTILPMLTLISGPAWADPAAPTAGRVAVEAPLPTAAPADVSAREVCPVSIEVHADGSATQQLAPACPEALRALVLDALAGWTYEHVTLPPGADHLLLRRTLVYNPSGETPGWSLGLGEPASEPGEPAVIHWSEAKLKRRINPVYPEAAKGSEPPQVTCTALLTVDTRGAVTQVETWGCPAPFDPAVLDSVPQWAFYPHKVNGQATAVRFELRLTFVRG